MGGLSFLDQARRSLRKIVLAIDRGGCPPRGADLIMACDLDLVWIEVAGEDRFQYMLTDRGQMLARIWRDDDTHGGNAA